MAKQRRRRQKKGELETMGEIGPRTVMIAGCSDPRLRRSYEQLAVELDGVLKLTPGVKFSIETFVPAATLARGDKLKNQRPLVVTWHTECRAYPAGLVGDRKARDEALLLGCQTRGRGIPTIVLGLRRDRSPSVDWVGLESRDVWLQALVNEVIEGKDMEWSYDDSADIDRVIVGDDFSAADGHHWNRALLVSADNIDNNMPTIRKVMAQYGWPSRKLPLSLVGVAVSRQAEIRDLFRRSEVPATVTA